MQRPLSGMLQEGGLHPASPLKDAAGEESLPNASTRECCREEDFSFLT